MSAACSDESEPSGEKAVVIGLIGQLAVSNRELNGLNKGQN